MEGLNLFVGEAVLLPIVLGCGRLAESAGGSVDFGVVADCDGGHGGVRGEWDRRLEPTPDFYIREGRPDKLVHRTGSDADCEIDEGPCQFSWEMSSGNVVCSGKNLSRRLGP